MAARPRQPVARGGMWSSPKPQNVSKETTELLKVMMEESKLTNFQRRQLQQNMKTGKSLPVQCLPTSSGSEEVKSASKQPKKPKVVNGRQLSYSGKRRKEVIDGLKEQNKEEYRPSPGKTITDKDKEKFQNMMAYGREGLKPEHTKRRMVKDPDEDLEVDRFEEVMLEIEDRRKFLDEMESLGQGAKYRTIITTEISQKIRELELIDKQRTEEMEQSLKEQNDAP